MSDRSSGSPERGDVVNPPTLPRRVQAGPPAFKPVPPPSDDVRGVVLVSVDSLRRECPFCRFCQW